MKNDEGYFRETLEGMSGREKGKDAEKCFIMAMGKLNFKEIGSCPVERRDGWKFPNPGWKDVAIAKATEDQDFSQKTDFWMFSKDSKKEGVGYEGWFRIQLSTEEDNEAKRESAYSAKAIPIFIPYIRLFLASGGEHAALRFVSEQFEAQFARGCRDLYARHKSLNFIKVEKEEKEKKERGY